MKPNDPLLLRALRRQPVERTPVWFMRQAGRVLPEYRAVREHMTLLEICRHPDVCAEVTLQPVRRFGVDAAILFADIMHPLVGAGVELDIVDNVGPVIAHPVRTAADVEALRPLTPEADLPYVLESIRLLKRELDAGNGAGNGAPATPLIGFAGAPFTLASYLIEGRASREFVRTKALMLGEPAVWRALMERLTDMIVAYLRAQRAAGCDALQLFDSWVGALSPNDYARSVQPYSRRILAELRSLGAPTIHFGVNTAALLPLMRTDGATAIGCDWRIGLDEAWRVIGPEHAIQGNLDPAALFAPGEVVAREVRDVLRRAGGRPGHVFNLGHGLHPSTPIDGVYAAIEAVHAYATSEAPA